MLAWTQIQVITKKLAGREEGAVRPEDLDEPWRSLYNQVQPLDDLAFAERELWRASAGLDDRQRLVDQVLEALAGILPNHPSLYDLQGELPPIRWLWPGWIPRGMLSLLGAAPGAGKSLVALDLARRILHGEPFPDSAQQEAGALPDAGAQQEAGGEPGAGTRGRGDGGARVIYVDAEAVPQILEQRATAWGMDRSRLYLLLPREPYGSIDLGDKNQQDRLLRMVYQLEPDLVVVDSLSSITTKGENQVEDVREVLRFLAALAGEFDVGLLLIHHLRKRGKAGPRPFDAGGPADLVTADEFRGSSHIITMARSVLALSLVQVGPEPDRNGPRRLEVVKTNLCRYPPALGVVFEERGRPPLGPPRGAGGREEGDYAGAGGKVEGGDGSVPWVRYVEVPKPYRQPTQAEACAKWLVELLAEAREPLKPKEVVALARDAGVTRGVVYRAREEARERVADTEGRRHPDNRWALAPESGG